MKEIAITGEKLGNEEDFLIAGDAYIDEKGDIYPKSISNVEIDDDSISVESITKQKIEEGDLVAGVVTDIKKNSAIIKIQNNLTKNTNLDLPAMIMVGDMSFGYLEEIRDALRIGDLVKARVNKIGKYGTEVTIKDRELGVEIPYCVNCRSKVSKKVVFRNKDIASILCGVCYTKQTRKLSGGF